MERFRSFVFSCCLTFYLIIGELYISLGLFPIERKVGEPPIEFTRIHSVFELRVLFREATWTLLHVQYLLLQVDVFKGQVFR